jgi:hypothetical protein
MAKPIAKPNMPNGVIPLSGKAGEWLSAYLENTEPDPEAQELQAQEDAEFIAEKAKELRTG